MKIFYKIFLIIFVVFTAINIYAIQWDLGAFNEENLKFWFSIAAGILGFLVVFILDNLSRLAKKA
ncbi:hypothetical protein [Elizabethkingia sp. JS20170427COW]|uniref:hypothetical protein n=1 Tax=Elizabethkingia sp. JS20170427COW TaxID=2583851 RepID=UPI0011106673|nr:hypothetical protein [Elizabethkingia sp. JS20170427COW]QCX53937.1 hypothetical protein FGE20_09430 [Elizabethkingia sp. JS20170427COW]